MGITAAVGIGAEAAADVAAVDVAAAAAADAAATAAAADVAGLTAADVALPSVVGDIAAGTYAYAAPEALASTGAALGTAEGAIGNALGEGSLLGPGFSSAADLTVGTGTAPIATGTEALAGGAAPSTTLAGTGAGAPLGGGVTSAIGSAAPAGALPESELAAVGTNAGLYSEPIGPTLGGQTLDSTLASQSVLQPAQIAQTPVIAGEPVSAGLTAPQVATQDTLGQLGVQEAGLNTPAPGTLASTATTATDAGNTALNQAAAQAAQGGNAQLAQAAQSTIGGNAVTQAPASFNPAGSLPSLATQPGVTAPAIPTVTTPVTAAPSVEAPLASPETINAVEGISKATSSLGSATEAEVAKSIGAAGSEGFGSQALNYLAKNPSLALAGAGLAANLLMQPDIPKFQPQLNAAAQNMTAQGQQLASYLATGTLPPGVQASINAAHEAAIASVRSQHAARGTSGSSMEAQDLQRINEAVVSQGASIATSLLQAGINEQQMANGIYANLMNTQLQQDQQMSNAIAGFSNALASGYARTATPVG